MTAAKALGLDVPHTLQPHRRQHWVIPPKANSAFVAAMEDVLAVYTRPREGDCPLVCLDETSKQLAGNSPPKMLASNLSIYTLQSD
jgi:hypothetical protein